MFGRSRGLDAGLARECAKGRRQLAWTDAMLTAEGLHPDDLHSGTWSRRQSWHALAGRLVAAGFVVQSQPLGPRGGQRWIITERTTPYDAAERSDPSVLPADY